MRISKDGVPLNNFCFWESLCEARNHVQHGWAGSFFRENDKTIALLGLHCFGAFA